jgi:Uncharacterized conserved protein
MKKIFFFASVILFAGLWTAFAEEQHVSPPSQSLPEPEQQYGSVEERRIVERLQAGGMPFALEREELDVKKNELKRLEGEVDKKIEQLNQIRVRVEKLLEQKQIEEQQRIGELAKMYEKMNAEKAATVLGAVDQELAVSILGQMKSKSAAKILNNMEREKAAKLTSAFSILDPR